MSAQSTVQMLWRHQCASTCLHYQHISGPCPVFQTLGWSLVTSISQWYNNEGISIPLAHWLSVLQRCIGEGCVLLGYCAEAFYGTDEIFIIHTLNRKKTPKTIRFKMVCVYCFMGQSFIVYFFSFRYIAVSPFGSHRFLFDGCVRFNRRSCFPSRTETAVVFLQ